MAGNPARIPVKLHKQVALIRTAEPVLPWPKSHTYSNQ